MTRQENILSSKGFPNLHARREYQLAILMHKIKHNVTELFNKHFH